MAYIVEADLKGLIPGEWLTASADDDGDGIAEAMAEVITTAEDQVNSFIAQRYALPVQIASIESGPLAFLRHASRYLAAAVAYGRRGMQKEFPWIDEVKDIRKGLTAIASGETKLYATLDQANDEMVAITEPSRVWSKKIGF